MKKVFLLTAALVMATSFAYANDCRNEDGKNTCRDGGITDISAEGDAPSTDADEGRGGRK